MSRWPGVYVIGLTGNIATGKSVVASILAELGAYVIDADRLAHEALYKGAPAYQPVVQAFGPGILREGGEIDRARLGAIVFRDPVRLEQLEAAVHPVVLTMLEARLRDAARPGIPNAWLSAAYSGARKDGKAIVVIEAIKLIESGMADQCDQVWATGTPAEEQLRRLVRHRAMSEGEARLRVEAQPSQLEKLARADVVFDNTGTLVELRAQVLKAWEKLLRNRG